MEENEKFCSQIESYVRSLQIKLKIENKSKNTISSYMQTYKKFIAFCKQNPKVFSFSTIKEDDIYAFLEYMSATMNKQGDIAPSTSNAVVSHLKRLFKHIERNSSEESWDFDKVFADIKLKQPKRSPKGISDDDVKKLLSYLEELKNNETFINIRNVLLFKIMLYGGLRASETVSLKIENFKKEDSLYKIFFRGKGDKERVSYIQVENIQDEVDTLVDVFTLAKNEYIAKTSGGSVMDRIQLNKMINSIYKRAGVNVSGVHILRHTAAKSLLSSGVSIVVVQSLLGHSSVQTTSIYANPTEDIIKRELEKRSV